MAKVAILCPSCEREYAVPEEHLGKKVTCANKACGKPFMAQSLVEPELADDIDEEVMEFPPPRKKRNSDGKAKMLDAPSAPDGSSSVCYFATLARLFVYAGMTLLIIGVVLPSTVHQPASGSGAFELPAGAIFNFPRAIMKLSFILLGLALSGPGASLWSASKTGPSLGDVIALAAMMTVVLGSVLVAVVKTLV